MDANRCVWLLLLPHKHNQLRTSIDSITRAEETTSRNTGYHMVTNKLRIRAKEWAIPPRGNDGAPTCDIISVFVRGSTTESDKTRRKTNDCGKVLDTGREAFPLCHYPDLSE